MPAPHCPHHAACNFHRTAAQGASPALAALVLRYCASAEGCRRCFRAHFARSAQASLGGDITPDARVLPGQKPALPASDLAADQTARLFARRAA